MDIRKTLFVSFTIYFIASVNCNFELQYIGENEFEIGDNATLVCEITPKIDAVESIESSWSQRESDGSPTTIGQITSTDSFIYASAPASLASRFSMSIANFEDGKVEATISNVGIADTGNYICSIEDKTLGDRFQESSSFGFTVYKLPSVRIEILQPVIDLRPLQENTESMASNSTETDEVETEESPVSSVIALAQCTFEGCYPAPSKITFQASTGQKWELLESDDFVPTMRNDGLYDVSVTLNVVPSSGLNQQRITCQASISEERRTATSSPSELITVFYPASYVTISFDPSNKVNENDFVTIQCNSDGNPAPQRLVHRSDDGNTWEATDGKFKFQAAKNTAGEYYCTAVDPIGGAFESNHMSLNVFSLDSVRIKGPEVLNEADSTLECVATHTGPVSYTWYKDNNPGTPISDQTFYRLDYKDAAVSGTYTCAVTGAGKTLRDEFTVAVEKPCKPNITTLINSSQKKSGDSFVKVTCVAHGIPGCEMSLTTYKDYRPTTSTNYAQLIIDPFPKQMDPYEITCTAVNNLGTKSVSEKLGDVCCIEPATGGLSGGVAVLIIIIVVFIVIGTPLACFLLKPSGSSSSKAKKAKVDDLEKANLNDPQASQ